MSTYRCTVVSGNGSATDYLTPMLQAWAAERSTKLEPGTFNLCADRFVMIAHGQRHESLKGFGKYAPRFRQEQDGFDPRLYPVGLNGSVRAWLYRWSEPGALPNFVGPQPGICESPSRFCEIVAETRLRETLQVGDGDIVRLEFGTPDPPMPTSS